MATTKVKLLDDNVVIPSGSVATTQSASDNTTKVATTAYVTTAIANLVDDAPSTLNTLNEIAAALNDDAALNTTLTNSIATKLPLAGGTLTGALVAPQLTVDNVGINGDTITLTGTSASGFIQTSSDVFQIGTSSDDKIDFFTNNAVAATILGSGNFGIGNNNPSSARLEIKGAKTQSGGAPIGNLLIADSTSLAANTGGGITFQGVYQSGGAITGLASIEAMKETATHNQYGGSLVFKAREDQGAMNEVARFTSHGNLKFARKGTNFESPGFTYHTNNFLYLRGGSAGLILADDANHNTIQIIDGSSGYINFETGDGTSRARIDASGNLLVGTTSTTVGAGGAGVTGFRVDGSSGIVQAAGSSTIAAIFNRTSSNGSLVSYRYNGSEIGNICTEGGDALIIQGGGASGSGMLFHPTGGFISPVRNSVKSDGTINLGRTDFRFNLGCFKKLDATDANGNVAVGYETHNVLGASGNTGDSNTAIGLQANEKLTTGSNNTAAGYRAGMNVTNGNYNVALGTFSMYTNQGGSRNTALGYQALYTASGNDHNTAIGNRALVTAGNNGSCTAVGSMALQACADNGHNNTAVGVRASLSTTSGQYNTSLGVDALEDNQTGQYNTACGSNALGNVTGSNNSALGYSAGKAGSPGGALGGVSNRIVLGNGDITHLYCETNSINTSDERDKTDFTDLDIGLDFVKQMKPYTFRWDKRHKYINWDTHPDADLNTVVHDGTHKAAQLDLGFKAQELEALEIAAGYKREDETNLVIDLTDDGTKYGIKYSKLVPILVKAIQELEARVATLEG